MEATKIIISLVLLISITSKSVFSTYYSQTTPYVPTEQKVTNLHFFFHDTLSGKNPTAVQIAQPNNTIFNGTGAPPFGTLFAIDDPLTVGPEVTSEVVGYAQGMYLSSSQQGLALVAFFDFGFTSGEFNGSSISVFSRNPIVETERELAVVGGRGKFRLAKGFAQLKTFFINPSNGDAIVEYNVTVVHD